MKVRIMTFERRSELAHAPYQFFLEYLRKGDTQLRSLTYLIDTTIEREVNPLEFGHALRALARALEDDCREEIR